MSEWGQFVTIDPMDRENIFNNKNYYKSSNCSQRLSSIYEDIQYDDIVRSYSSEVLPPPVANKKQDYMLHPILSITYAFYYCIHKLWR